MRDRMSPPAICRCLARGIARGIARGTTRWERPDMDRGDAIPLVEVADLSVKFVSRETTVHAVNNVSFAAWRGEVLCILGESGSGKSVTMRSLIRLLPRQAQVTGAIRVNGRDVLAMRSRELRDLRGGL